MSKGFSSTYRTQLLAWGLLACFGAVGVRLVSLHVVNREAGLNVIKQARASVTPFVQNARRGDIIDANNFVLATSRPMWELGVDPFALRENETVFKEKDKAAREKDRTQWPILAAMIDLPEAQLRELFRPRYRTPKPAAPEIAIPGAVDASSSVGAISFKPLAEKPAASSEPATLAPALASDDADADAGSKAEDKDLRIRWVKLKEDVTDADYQRIMALGIKGVYGTRIYRRTYPGGGLAAHLIGYVDRQQKPLAGAEAYADFYLRGQRGWREGDRDARHRELAQFNTREVLPVDGYNVKLSIDSRVQDFAEAEVAYLAKTYNPKKITIIVSDPRDGFILGLANYPSFDLNEYNKVPKDELERMKNVAITDRYEPGSVFKIVAVSAGLDLGLITPNDTFDVEEQVAEYRGLPLRLSKEDHRFANPKAVPVTQIVSYSSNRGAARIALKIGDEKFHDYAEKFGFGRRLGFPFGGEVSGTLNSVAYWRKSPLDFTRVPMGHSVDATALQMHQAMSVIASGGILYRPQVIREIRSGNDVVHSFLPYELGRAIKPDTARTMAKLLMTVASKEGTAELAAIPGFEVAGKTGTTQMLINGKYSTEHHIASFVGFFPASRPQVAISVIVEDAHADTPSGVAYGGRIAAPAFRRLGEKLIPILYIKSPQQQQQPVRFDSIAALEGGRR